MNLNPQEASASIYARLLAGESMEDIMNDITAQANEAQARYEEFQRLEAERVAAEMAAKQAEIARQERETAKRERMIDIINEILYYIAEYYPALGYTVEDIDKVDDATIYALADLCLMTLDMEVAQKAVPKKSPKLKVDFDFRALPKKAEAKPVLDEAVKPTETKKKPSVDDAFDQFFKLFGLN